MAKIDFFIFGYRKLKIDPADLSLVTGILIRASIPSVINNDGTITVRERDFEKIDGLISGRIGFTYSDAKGIYGFLSGISNRGTLLFAAAISSLVLIFLSSLVWDIRVDGNEKITDSEVILALKQCGFEIGDFWINTDTEKIESALLNTNENISWVNINRRGTVAYIKVIEKEEKKEELEETKNGYANIVAASDCVIEEITVKSGIPAVKAGDVVKAGDILVIGSLPEEAGGGFCRAEASVIGRVSDSVSVSVDRISEISTYTERKLYSRTVKIFNFSLNIFKLYGNLTDECVIIDDEITYSLFDSYKLPICISSTYVLEERLEKVTYTDEELVNIASSRLSSLMASRLLDSDLIRVKTEGYFTDSGYFICSDMLFLSDVGAEVEFDVE